MIIDIYYYVYLGCSLISIIMIILSLSIALIKKKNKEILSHYLIIVLLSEILSIISKSLHLFKSERTINHPIGICQVFIGIFCNFCSLNTSIIISIKILDSVIYESVWFRNKQIQKIIYFFIFIIPFFFTVIFGFIQLFYYNDLARNDDTSSFGSCNPINCWVAPKLGNVLLGFIILFLIVIFILNMIVVGYLRKQQRKVSIESSSNMMHKSSYKKVNNLLSKFVYKVLVFDISSVIVWSLIYSGRLFKLIINDNNKNDFWLYFYEIGCGLRGTIYSFLFLFIYFDSCTYCCLRGCHKNDDEGTKDNDDLVIYDTDDDETYLNDTK